MKEGTTSLGARAQSAIARAAVLYKPRLETFNFNFISGLRGGIGKHFMAAVTDENTDYFALKGHKDEG
jgi:hypothetical protein